MPIPVVAGVNGAAIGGGLTLAIATDIVFAKQSATFSIRFLAKNRCGAGYRKFLAVYSSPWAEPGPRADSDW